MNFEGLFLGPQAENHRFFKDILSFLIDEHIHWRRNFHPEDVPSITLQDQSRRDFIASQQKVQETLFQLSSRLKQSSLPWHSPRYLGHMTADILLPAHLAYMLTMLYNPNNVAWEVSPITTSLELQVGLELAELMGFDKQQAFGHITSGGTIANIEALWMARNLKSIPKAIKQVRPDLVEGMSDRMLMNLSPQQALELLSRAEEQIEDIKRLSIRGKGVESDGIGKVVVPRTRHYSWDKMADVLGIGQDNLIAVDVTDHYRMDINDFTRKVQAAVGEGSPILAVIPVVGTTEEGAVDPVHEILAVREQFEAQGVSFYIHVDAAYGGYIRSLFTDREKGFLTLEDLGTSLREKHIIMDSHQYPSESVHSAFKAMSFVDSVTIDPHKLGYVPYQAGAVVFRDKRIRNAVSYFAPYVFEEKNQTQNPVLLGSFILEGSKSGAAAAAVWAAHQVVGLDMEGYGRIIGKSIDGAVKFYSRMVEQKDIHAGGKVYHMVPLVRPDTNIVVYALNRNGNRSLQLMNNLNRAIKDKLQYTPGNLTHKYDFVVSSTSLTRQEYGNAPLDFLKRLGIPEREWDEVGEVFVLRSTFMSPFTTTDFADMDCVSLFFTCIQGLLQDVS